LKVREGNIDEKNGEKNLTEQSKQEVQYQQ